MCVLFYREDRTKSVMYDVEFQDVNGTSSIQFNICGETVRRCPDLQADSANIVNSVGTCNHLSRVYADGEQKPGRMELISEKNPSMGVIINYEGGNMCNATSHYSLKVQINCNPNLDKTTFALDKESLKNVCDPVVIMNSPHACPVLSMGPLGQIIGNYNYWVGIPMLLIGGYLVALGGRFTGVTLFIFTTLAVSLAQLFIIFIFILPSFFPIWSVFIVYFINLGMGLGLGYGAMKWPRIGVTVMGFSLGCLLGFLVYYSFLATAVNTIAAKVITVVAMAVAMAVLFIVLVDHMVIISSAIFGSYTLIRVSLSDLPNVLNLYLGYLNVHGRLRQRI